MKYMSEDKTVPFRCCGNLTTFTGTKLCNSCWEVKGRIEKFISSKNGFSLVIRKIKKVKIREWQDKWLKEVNERFLAGEVKPFPTHVDLILTSINYDTHFEEWKVKMDKHRTDLLCSEIIDDAINNKFLWLEVSILGQ